MRPAVMRYRQHGLNYRSYGGAVISGQYRCGGCARVLHTQYGFRMHLRIVHAGRAR